MNVSVDWKAMGKNFTIEATILIPMIEFDYSEWPDFYALYSYTNINLPYTSMIINLLK